MATINLLRFAGTGCRGTRFLFQQQSRSLSRLGSLRAIAAPPSQSSPSNQIVQKRDYISRASTNVWAAERSMSAALLVLLPAGVIFPGNLLLDLSIGVLLPLHAHFGLHQVFLDYIHTHIGHRIANIALPLLTGAVILSFFYFNFTDIGITAAFRKFWTAL